jgi:hypothetical protein
VKAFTAFEQAHYHPDFVFSGPDGTCILPEPWVETYHLNFILEGHGLTCRPADNCKGPYCPGKSHPKQPHQEEEEEGYYPDYESQSAASESNCYSSSDEDEDDRPPSIASTGPFSIDSESIWYTAYDEVGPHQW